MGLIINMYTFGCFAALSGLIIARLEEDETSSIHMTHSEESWFGKEFVYIKIYHILFNINSQVHLHSLKKSIYFYQKLALPLSGRWWVRCLAEYNLMFGGVRKQ